MDVTAMSTTHWYGLYKRLSIALQDALGCLTPEWIGRAEHAPELSFARAALNAAIGDALAAWNAAHPDALLRLPRELTREIFRRLPLESRARIVVSHVSRRWRDVALSDPFLWNSATFSGREPPVDWTIRRRRRRGPSTGLLRKKARILRELLARSAPVPFSLTWEDEMLPQRIYDIVLQNLHRMQALTVGLSRRGFQRLCALPAPGLRSFVCTRYSGLCVLPARWDAPVLQKLELLSVRFPAAARLDAVRELVVFEASGLDRRGFRLSSVFPALASLEIIFFTPEMIPCLAAAPATLSDLKLIARERVDYAPVLEAFRRCSPRTLHLSPVGDAEPVLALFVSLVSGTWSMDIRPRAQPHAGFRTSLISDESSIVFAFDDSEGPSLVRDALSYLDSVSSLTAPVHVLAQLDGMEHWDRRLPALRTLGLVCTRGTTWPESALTAIRTPGLERVSIHLSDGGPSWATQLFPGVLRSRFVYTRPLLAQIKVEAKNENGLQEAWLAELRALSELVVVDLGHETRVYAHQ